VFRRSYRKLYSDAEFEFIEPTEFMRLALWERILKFDEMPFSMMPYWRIPSDMIDDNEDVNIELLIGELTEPVK